MNIVIRKAEPHDVNGMLALVTELAEFEKSPGEVIATEEMMLRYGFGDEAIYQALVADVDGKIVGTAIFYTAYSTWKGKMIYLDDFVVTRTYRQFGIGKKLFEELGRIAKEAGANQLRWHVLEWNTPAINFYKKYQASVDAEWITCKLTREKIETMF